MSDPTRVEVEVDPHRCTGAQMCGATAPDTFSYDDEAFTSRGPSGPVPFEQHIRDAVESCPVEAITMRDAETGEQLFP